MSIKKYSVRFMIDNSNKNIWQGLNDRFGVYMPTVFYCILFLLFLAEYSLFKFYVINEVNPYYPPYFDQAYFLRETYYLYEQIRSAGYRLAWIPILVKKLFLSDAQGNIIHSQTNLFLLLAGPSRFAAMLPNLFYFLTLQLTVFVVIKKTSGRYIFSFIALGLLLSVAYPFFFAGSLFDYRLDFVAFCMYGIFVSAIVGSDSFLHRRWAVVATLVASLLVLFRHVTIVYVWGLYFSLIVFILISYYFNKSENYKRESTLRIKRIIASGLAVFAVMTPFLWLSRVDIYNYYGKFHVLGGDKGFRLKRAGVYDTLSYVLYYPKSLVIHLGPLAIYITIFLLLFSLVLILIRVYRGRKFSSEKLDTSEIERPFFSKENFVFMLLSILLPIFIVTFDYNKSPVVAAIVILPIVLITVWTLCYTWLRITGEDSSYGPFWSRIGKGSTAVLVLSTIIIFILGLNHQVTSYNMHTELYQHDNKKLISKMYLDIGDYCLEKGIEEPLIAFDRIVDYLTNDGITAVYFENRAVFMNVRHTLGNSLVGVTWQEAKKAIRSSDIVIFSKTEPGITYFPFDVSIDKIRPELNKLITSEFKLFREYSFDEKIFGVYVRPVARKKRRSTKGKSLQHRGA